MCVQKQQVNNKQLTSDVPLQHPEVEATVFAGLLKLTALVVTVILEYFKHTYKYTMYCGGEPEHKHVANKCMHETIINARVINLQA